MWKPHAPEADSDPAMTGTSEAGVNMERRGVRIVDTFAEAFDMRAARVVITANSPGWARTGAQRMTGFATSVIGCKVEAGIEAELAPDEHARRPSGSQRAALRVRRRRASPAACSTESDRRFSPARPPPVSTACPRRPSASSSADSCATSATGTSRASCSTVTATGGFR